MSVEATGDGIKWLSIMVIGVMMTLGGCLYGVRSQDEQTSREKEKTNQLAIQWKIDSLNATTKSK